ncbi:MAG: hypothetical protein J7578_21425, partial [Chitinophagaceae bacterium]|nr:hypothetical protein [Chitinophagaceae bacterium]
MIRNISLIIFLVLMFGCKKEAALQAENADDNTLTVKDNPSDPVDHAIYQFYQSTGIPCFYNDTISRKEVGTVNGVPRYFYKRLTVNWSPALGVDTFTQFRIPLNKADLLPMLSLIKNELLPLIPDNIPIHSILFADTVFMYPTIWVPDRPAKTEMNAFSGFNTLVLRIINPDTLTAESKKHYLNDVLKEICVR